MTIYSFILLAPVTLSGCLWVSTRLPTMPFDEGFAVCNPFFDVCHENEFFNSASRVEPHFHSETAELHLPYRSLPHTPPEMQCWPSFRVL